MLENFEAVYYSKSTPSIKSLTILSLIFDKIYFPWVYIPSDNIDEEWVIKEITRIKNFGRNDFETSCLLETMNFALINKHLKDFCIFTWKPWYTWILENWASELSNLLEELIYWPPPKNFTPSIRLWFSKWLAGNPESSINWPSWLTYPANALIYSKNNNMFLVNDNPFMPVPSLGGISVKDNAKLLSTILAMESVRMVLPTFNILSPKEIPEFRHQINPYLKPFKLNMIKLSKELNQLINNNASIEEIQIKAKFLAETTIYPELEELKHIINSPTKPWYKRVIQFWKYIPEFLVDLSSIDSKTAIAKLLAKYIEEIWNIGDDIFKKKEKIRQNWLYYLLKISERISKKQKCHYIRRTF